MWIEFEPTFINLTNISHIVVDKRGAAGKKVQVHTTGGQVISLPDEAAGFILPIMADLVQANTFSGHSKKEGT